jgi:hypothetical protein
MCLQVEMSICDVDIESIRAQRASVSSRCIQASTALPIPTVHIDACLATSILQPMPHTHMSDAVRVFYSGETRADEEKSVQRIHSPQEEIGRGVCKRVYAV